MFHFFTSVVLIVSVLIYGSNTVQANNIQEYYKQEMANMMECVKEYTIVVQDLEALKHNHMPDSVDVKCFLACFYKKGGVMDDKGNLAVDSVIAIGEKQFANDPTKMGYVKKFAEVCRSVNEVELSGDHVQCERAALIYQCITDKVPEINRLVGNE